jgi:hypothetical protein
MRTLPAESKLVLAVVALSVAAGAGGAELVAAHFEEKVEEVGGHVLQGAAEAFATQQRSEVEKLSAALEVVMASSDLRAAFLAGDRERLLRVAAPVLEVLRERSRITHWYFHGAEPAPRVFLRVHRPELHGDAVQRVTLRRAIDTQDVGAGLELGRTAFALRVVRPWTVEGRVIGYMELAEEVDHFLSAMRSRTGDDYGLLVQKRFLDEQAWKAVLGPRANTWNARADVVVVDAAGFTDGIAAFDGDVEHLPDRGRFLGEIQRGGRASIHGVFPVADAAGRRLGALYVVHDFTAHHQAVRGGWIQAAVVLALLSLAMVGATAALARGLVFRRLTALRRGLELRLGGRAPRGAPGRLASHDDLGRIEALLVRALGEPSPGAADPPPPAPPGPGAPGR